MPVKDVEGNKTWDFDPQRTGGRCEPAAEPVWIAHPGVVRPSLLWGRAGRLVALPADAFRVQLRRSGRGAFRRLKLGGTTCEFSPVPVTWGRAFYILYRRLD